MLMSPAFSNKNNVHPFPFFDLQGAAEPLNVHSMPFPKTSSTYAMWIGCFYPVKS